MQIARVYRRILSCLFLRLSHAATAPGYTDLGQWKSHIFFGFTLFFCFLFIAPSLPPPPSSTARVRCLRRRKQTSNLKDDVIHGRVKLNRLTTSLNRRTVRVLDRYRPREDHTPEGFSARLYSGKDLSRRMMHRGLP